MPEGNEKTTLGSLIDAGLIEATVGFPFGGHNDGNEGMPHIRPFNVRSDGEIDLGQIKAIPSEAAAGKPRLRIDDIIFNNTNTKELVGKCALWERDDQYVFSNHMTRVRVLDGSVVPGYLSFAILHHWFIGRSEMLARAHVAQASIMGERFREIEFTWRDLNEQRRIASLLTQVQHARRSQDAQIANAAELKRAAMRELFTRGLRGEAQQETEIGSMPASWNAVPLGDVCLLSTGTTPSTKRDDYYRGDVPFIKTAEIVNNRLMAATSFVSDQAVSDYNLRIYPPGTIFMAMYGQGKTRGQVALLELPATTSQNAAAIQPIAALESAFLWHFLLSRYNQLRGMGSLGHLSHLNLGYLRELLIPLPPTLDEQREIVAVLDAIERKIDLHRRKRAVLDDLFKALLHKLMTGEIRIADLDLSVLGPKPVAEAAA